MLNCNSSKTIILLLVLIFPADLVLPADSKKPNSKLSSADASFVKEASAGGLMETELGKLAQTKALDDKVKEFGKRMERDHSKAHSELMKIASGKGIQPSSGLDRTHKSKVDKLSKLSGADFDREYMQSMIGDHKEVIKTFQRQSEKGSDQDLRKFASQTLPTLKEHLQLAEGVARGIQNSMKRSLDYKRRSVRAATLLLYY